MATDSGFSNQKKKGIAQFETVHDLGSSSFGKVAANKALFEILPSQAIVSVTDILGSDGQVQYWNVELTGHTAAAGNTLRFDAGLLLNFYFEIMQVIDANNFYILPISNTKPTPAMTATVMGWVTQKMSPNGEVSVSITSTPTSYEYDGLPQTVIQDTSDTSNNRALPNLNFIYKEGVQLPITDSATPANVVAMPVKIMSAGGANINITAGDINVQLTDMGANFDASRIGDGSGNYLGINASQEAKVRDADSIAQLSILNTVDFATEAKQDALKGVIDTMAMDISEISQDVMFIRPDVAASLVKLNDILTAIGVTNAKDFATQTTLASVLAAIGTTNAKDFATQTTLAALEAKLGTLGQKASAGSAPVVLSTGQESILTSIDTRLTTISNILTGRAFSDFSSATSNGSVSNPVGSKGFVIQNSTRAAGAVRFTPLGLGASATVGYLLEPGQSTSYIDGIGPLDLFSADATTFDVTILWFV